MTRDDSTMTRREFCRETAGVGASMAALTALGSLPASAGTFESDELTYMSASELLPLFRARRLSPVEVLEAQIARIEDKNPAVKAVNDTYFDEAMKAARASEKRYMDGTTRPLEGLTLAVKDEHTIAGKITTNGSLLRENDVQAETAIIVERMQEAGVIIHARTTTPENSFAMVTWSLLWGITRNPWNLYYTCGGSSGGSSAATATGMTTLATGSDLAGSIRIPASVNGLYGFKPPRGRVPVLMPGSMAPWWSDGPLARTYEDMVMFQNTVAGPDLRDMYSLKPKMVIPDRLLGVQGMRIALCVNMGFFRVAPEVEANLRAAAKRLSSSSRWDLQNFRTMIRGIGIHSNRVSTRGFPDSIDRGFQMIPGFVATNEIHTVYHERRVGVKVGRSAIALAMAGISDRGTPMSASVALSRLARACLVVVSRLQRLTAVTPRSSARNTADRTVATASPTYRLGATKS